MGTLRKCGRWGDERVYSQPGPRTLRSCNCWTRSRSPRATLSVVSNCTSVIWRPYRTNTPSMQFSRRLLQDPLRARGRGGRGSRHHRDRRIVPADRQSESGNCNGCGRDCRSTGHSTVLQSGFVTSLRPTRRAGRFPLPRNFVTLTVLSASTLPTTCPGPGCPARCGVAKIASSGAVSTCTVDGDQLESLRSEVARIIDAYDNSVVIDQDERPPAMGLSHLAWTNHPQPNSSLWETF